MKSSTQTKPMRQAAASTRACLVEAAARSWSVSAAECRTDTSTVIHDPSGRRLAYGALVGGAAAITPPKDPPLKNVSAFRLIGRPLKRFDTPQKTNGETRYAIDVMPPGVKFATLMASPVLGGKVVHVDDRRVGAIPGVRQIVVLDNLVAVVGDHMWAAKSGLEALDITWDDGPNTEVSSELIWSQLRGASLRDGVLRRDLGDVALTGSRAVNDPSGMNVVQIVLSGESTRTAEGLAMMPAFADAYSDTEIAAVANYVTARFGAAPSHLAAQDVVPLRQSQYLSVPDRNEKHP
jgi:CO/xanthine dehydrogenase Mo-binding subunit